MVRIRKDEKAMPFPRRLTRTEIQRFWMKLMEDVAKCWEVMPNTTTFMTFFGELTYDSFNEAKKYYRVFKNTICRGEEPQIPAKFRKIQPLGKSIEDEIVIVTGRLYSNEQWRKQKGIVVTNEEHCSLDNIVEEVNRVRGTRPSIDTVKATIIKAWKIREAKEKGFSPKNEEDLSWYTLAKIPKECLEMIIGKPLGKAIEDETPCEVHACMRAFVESY